MNLFRNTDINNQPLNLNNGDNNRPNSVYSFLDVRGTCFKRYNVPQTFNKCNFLLKIQHDSNVDF